MKNVDRWFILIGLLYGALGFAFGIWVGINERFDQAHLHAHINLIGWASMVLFGLLYRAFPALAQNQLAAQFRSLQSRGDDSSHRHSTGASASDRGAAAFGSLLVLVGMLTFLANYYLNAFRKPSTAD